MNNGGRFNYPVSLLGAGLLWGWGFLYFFSGRDISRSVIADSFYLISALMAVLVFIAIRKILVEDKWIVIAASMGCAFLLLGTAVIFVFLEKPVMPTCLLLMCSIASGIGQAIFWIAWGVVLSRFEVNVVEISFSGWLPVLAGIFLVVPLGRIVAPQQATLVLSALLPIASLVALWRSMKSDAYCAGPLIPSRTIIWRSEEGRDEHGDFLHEFLKELMSVLCAFIAVRVVWNALLSSEKWSDSVTMVYLAFSAIVLLLFMLISLNTTRRFGLPTLYAWLLPLFVLGVTVMHIQGDATGFLAFLCIATVNLGLEVMSKLYFVHMAQRRGDDEVLIIGMGFSAGAAAGIVFLIVAAGLSAGGLDASMTVICLAAVFLFTLVVSAEMGNGKDYAISSTRNVMQQKSADEDDEIVVRCNEAVSAYGLSAREAEVLELLVRGRSRAYIREALFISKGTVDTHVHHIYSKMGISSKEALMKIILDSSE